MTAALDYSYARPDPSTILAVGVRQVRIYCGNARPDQAYCDALRAAGIEIVWIMETISERAAQGYQAGVYDVAFAEQRVAERGGQNERLVYCWSDGSRFVPSSGGDQIAEYVRACEERGVRRAPQRGGYGNRYALDAGSAAYGDPTWGVRTWDADDARDECIQEPNIASPIDGTDYNTLTGISPTPPAILEDDDMAGILWLNCTGGNPTKDVAPGYMYAVRDFRVSGYLAANAPAAVMAQALSASTDEVQVEIDRCESLRAGIISGGSGSTPPSQEDVSQAVDAALANLRIVKT